MELGIKDALDDVAEVKCVPLLHRWMTKVEPAVGTPCECGKKQWKVNIEPGDVHFIQ